MAIVIELGEYVIPDFHVAVAVTANGTSRFSTAVFFTAVVVNFRTWSARACAVFPEVVFFSKTENPVFGDADLFIPDFKSLIILFVDGRIETVFFQTDNLCQKFPGPGDRFMFEIIAKREVSEHFEKCTVTVCFTDIFNIAGTDTFLTGRYPVARRNLLPCKIRL